MKTPNFFFASVLASLAILSFRAGRENPYTNQTPQLNLRSLNSIFRPEKEMLLVLSDYECPGCRVVHSQITAKRLKDKMEVKFIDAPLKRHPLSMEVAVKVSSLELSKQEEVRAKLMTNPKLLQNFAKQTKDSIIGKAAIEKNLKIFNEIGCKATPTILFYSHNQKEWTEIQHLSQLESRF